MTSLRDLLLHSEPLLLFLTIGTGYLLGRITIRNFSLGVAGVLFAGLALGAWQPSGAEPLTLSPEIMEIGLILFVYAVGLTSGPGFFAALGKRGIRFNLSVVGGLISAGIFAVVAGRFLSLSAPFISGTFCGALTNTPALAAATNMLAGTPASAEPTLAYSISYPFGILCGLLAMALFARIDGQKLKREKELALAAEGPRKVRNRNFAISNPALFEKAIGELRVQESAGVLVSRIRHGAEISVPSKYTILHQGDVVTAVGPASAIDAAATYFGEVSDEHLEEQRARVDMRRILMSKREHIGKTIDELELDRRFGAQITRLRRADFDIVPDPGMRLELGDRLRVVAPKDRIAEVSRFFGDSDRHVSELDYPAITFGISLGVLVGMIPIPFPGGSTISLGIAGGPLVVALILGKLGRTGNIVWSIPYESNMTIRHIGLLFFLAGVGVKAGSRIQSALETNGLSIFVLGIAVTLLGTAVTMLLLRTFGGASSISTLGATSAMQTQPATLAKASEIAPSDEIFVAYATAYPVAMITKIIIAQVIVSFF